MLIKFEQSLNERVKEIEKQRESLDKLKSTLEQQIQQNNKLFDEERDRLKIKQK